MQEPLLFRRTSRHAFYHAAVLFLPLACLVLGLKLYKIWQLAPQTLWAERWGLLYQDLLFLLVVGFAMLVPLERSKGWLRGLVVLTLHITITALCLLYLLEHAYFLRTGRFAGWSLLKYSFSLIDSVARLVRVQLTPTAWLAIAGVLVLNLFPLWVARTRRFRRWLRRGENPGGIRVTTLELALLGTLLGLLLAPSGKASGQQKVALQSNALWRVFNEAQRELKIKRKRTKSRTGGQLFDATGIKFAPVPKEKQWNVVILILESVRARSTTMFRPKLPSTPFLQSLAPKAMQVRYMYPVIPHTTKALVSIMCGIPPKLTPLPFEASIVGLPARCLPKLLGDLGYRTAFFQAATRHFENRTRLVKNMGFQQIRAFEDMPTKGFTRVNRHLGYEDKIMVKPSFQWIDKARRQGKPFFVSYLTLASHFYYRLPRSFPTKKYVTGGDKYMNKYLNTLRYTDSFVADIYKGLKARGLLKSTLIVVLGDHGEAFMEHGLRFHSDGAYEEFMRVPTMIIHPKGLKKGQWIKGNRQQIDLVPTIAELLGTKLVQGHLPGKSLLQPVSPKRKLYLSCWNVPFCIAKLEGRTKSIFNFRRREHELFDLTKDPMEKLNLRAKKTAPAYWKRLEKELMGWRAHVNQLYNNASISVLEQTMTWREPKVQVKLNVRFGSYIQLVGYRLASDQVKLGHRVKVTFVYKVLKKLPKGWKFLYHSYAMRHRRRAWKERFINLKLVPLTGALPPQEWKPGSYITDHQAFQLRPVRYALRRGMHFRVYHGLWHKKHGRLPVIGAHGRPVRQNRLLICDIHIR